MHAHRPCARSIVQHVETGHDDDHEHGEPSQHQYDPPRSRSLASHGALLGTGRALYVGMRAIVMGAGLLLLAACNSGGSSGAEKTVTDTTVTPAKTPTDTTVVQKKVDVSTDTLKKTHNAKKQ